jgi:HEAT repeat protein
MPGPVGRRRQSPSLWLAVLVVPGALAASLLIWGAVHVLTPRRDADLPDPNGPVAQGQLPQVQAPPIQVPRGPAPKPVPKVEGDAYFQAVWADLHSDDRWARKAAVERLANMKPNGARTAVARKLVELTDVEDPFIRRPAVAALGNWGSEAEVPALLAAIAHKDLWTRKEALKVIGRFKDRKTLEPAMISFREPSTRAEAGQALRQMGQLAEPDVLALLSGDDLSLKRAAIEVLADIGTEKSVPALRAVVASTNIHVSTHLRGLAEEALAAIAKRQKP